MNLGELIEFCGNVLDYDPTNDTYRGQLVDLLNEAQTQILTDRPWAFAQKEKSLAVYTDLASTVTLTNGSGVATGAFDLSTDPVLPGSTIETAILKVPTLTGDKYREIKFVQNATTLFLDRAWTGLTGNYEATIRRRKVYLPSDTASVTNVSDPAVGTPRKSLFLSQWEGDDANIDRETLGTIEAYMPSSGKRVRAPQVPSGVTVQTVAPGQGVRTVSIWMVNVEGPASLNSPTYRRDVSNGFESAFSKVRTYSLSDTQTLYFTPETIPAETGLYRRYYMTCPEANILAPVRIRSGVTLAGVVIGTDTVSPLGGVQLQPDIALSTLESQSFQSKAVRYVHNQSAEYRAIELYPHPSANQLLDVRTLIAPDKMLEDQDAPLCPAAYAQILAYAALEILALKVNTPALSTVYARKKALLLRAMEARYLGQIPRRIRKGSPALGQQFMPNPFGKMVFTP